MIKSTMSHRDELCGRVLSFKLQENPKSKIILTVHVARYSFDNSKKIK